MLNERVHNTWRKIPFTTIIAPGDRIGICLLLLTKFRKFLGVILPLGFRIKTQGKSFELGGRERVIILSRCIFVPRLNELFQVRFVSFSCHRNYQYIPVFGPFQEVTFLLVFEERGWCGRTSVLFNVWSHMYGQILVVPFLRTMKLWEPVSLGRRRFFWPYGWAKISIIPLFQQI